MTGGKGKVKNRYLKIACVSVFVCIISLTLMGISGDRESMAVEQLLIKRTDIMENVPKSIGIKMLMMKL